MSDYGYVVFKEGRESMRKELGHSNRYFGSVEEWCLAYFCVTVVLGKAILKGKGNF